MTGQLTRSSPGGGRIVMRARRRTARNAHKRWRYLSHFARLSGGAFAVDYQPTFPNGGKNFLRAGLTNEKSRSRAVIYKGNHEN